MRIRNSNFLAKILIFFSIILIVCGIVLQVRNDILLDPNNVIVLDDENNVSITPIDKDDTQNSDDNNESDSNNEDDEKSDVNGNDNSDGATSNNGDNSNTSSGSGGNSNVNNGSNSTSGSNNSPSNVQPSAPASPVPSTSPAPSTTPASPAPSVPPVLTIEETNLRLRDSIQSTYGVTIKYGSETSGYSVGGLTTVTISDALACQNALNNLKNALALYPSGFFQELSRSFNPLTFYLVQRYSNGSVTGVTHSFSTRTDISIAVDFGFGETFHHEVYHYIEYYMEARGFYYTSWLNLNPAGFSYGNINSQYSYSRTFSENSYFVNDYAQTSAAEDRASTFEYMMSGSRASCLNNGKVVWAKARTMCEAIDLHLSSVSANVKEYWERFVY